MGSMWDKRLLCLVWGLNVLVKLLILAVQRDILVPQLTIYKNHKICSADKMQRADLHLGFQLLKKKNIVNLVNRLKDNCYHS